MTVSVSETLAAAAPIEAISKSGTSDKPRLALPRVYPILLLHPALLHPALLHPALLHPAHKGWMASDVCHSPLPLS